MRDCPHPSPTPRVRIDPTSKSMGTARINIKMPPQRPRTTPCSCCTRLFVDKQALDAHFNDVHRACPTPRAVPKDRGNLAPAKSHPPSQKNPKPLQGIHLASESDRTGPTNNCDNVDSLFVPFQGSTGHPPTKISSVQPSRNAIRRWGNSIQFVQESEKTIDTYSPARKTITTPSSNRRRGSQPKPKRNKPQFQLEPNTTQWMNMSEDLDWGLCDKECGWCGHCMDGVDI